ncbi:L-type lectin-domain containing receptor kinase S.4-like [Asparagus officinalis]|uniref:L-type lectin-domain containing receptor kinase S.4-like n=1 Tax=Asparagus officinalis TaxID=4686 RepID=UPI00098E04A8|nr:L-type lectin-domain containing receptor kinase S.4-like [Asparagus officinalis]
MAPSSHIFTYTCFIILFASSALPTTNNFIFNGFQGASNLITLTGDARITPNGVLQLTNDTKRDVGQAFFSSPFQMLTNHISTQQTVSFSTTFVFDIVTVGSGGGHGFTFAISPSKTLPGGGCCQYLGLLGNKTNGNFSNHVLAVEFDTVQSLTELRDIDDNHVGIDINSLISNASEPAAYYANTSKKEPVELGSGAPVQAWIDYDGVSKNLKVTIAPVPVDKPRKPLISKAVDLALILKESMYVGFTASTGKLTSSHYILGWSFKINGVAPFLDGSHLPLPPEALQSDNSQGSKILGLKIGLASSIGTLVLLVIVLLILMYLHKRSRLAETLEDWELDYPHRFPYKDLYRATKGFKETQILGSGGFGQVYKGVMPVTGEEVAIKRISNSSRQGVKEFVAEIASLGQLRHRNLVQLQGWCKRDQDLILVYEYMLNGSLDTFLFNNEKTGLLSWNQRFKIIKDIAFGLLYLHEEWGQVIVHRDIKASNVLLDSEMKAKLGDFGLARLYEHGSNPHTTRVVGTVGYLAPELSRTGKASTNTDVYAYGALVLEVVCGRRPIEPTAPPTEVLLLDRVRQCWLQNMLIIVLDSRLGESYVREEVELALKLGLLCSQSDPQARPTMRQVIQYLNGHEKITDDGELVFSEADTWDFVSGSNQSSRGMLSTSSLKGGR